jgi:ABC-type sulfate/molybdate transport systems ATPase subunit
MLPAGSVIAVSHDRYFLRRIATRIVTVEDGKLVDYQGDYEVIGAWGTGSGAGVQRVASEAVCMRVGVLMVWLLLLICLCG